MSSVFGLRPGRLDLASISIKITSYEFDGFNISAREEIWDVKYFKDHVSVASLKYRPSKFEEKVKPSVIKNASESGRKFLDYQGLHYCHYNGPAYPTRVNDGRSAFGTEVRMLPSETRSDLTET